MADHAPLAGDWDTFADDVSDTSTESFTTSTRPATPDGARTQRIGVLVVLGGVGRCPNLSTSVRRAIERKVSGAAEPATRWDLLCAITALKRIAPSMPPAPAGPGPSCSLRPAP